MAATTTSSSVQGYHTHTSHQIQHPQRYQQYSQFSTVANDKPRRRRQRGRPHRDRRDHDPKAATIANTIAKLGDNNHNDDNNDTSDNDLDEETALQQQKRLDVAIVGYPNAGKSQLLNALLGQKIAAVSRKRHTTRHGILGLSTHHNTQIVFCDTPGFMTSTDKIGRDLTMTTKGHMADVDVSLVVIDAAKTKLTDDYVETLHSLIWNALYSTGGKVALVLNKIDLVQPTTKLVDIAKRFGKMADQLVAEKLKLQQQQQHLEHEHPPSSQPPPQPSPDMPELFYTCAKQGHNDRGVQDVLQYLLDQAPHREWLLSEPHLVTTMDYQERVAEIIREKIYRSLHREVPHQIQQRNRQLSLVRGDDVDDDVSDNWDSTTLHTTKTNNVILIHQDLLVRSKSHLQLLQKSNGMNLQRIHDAAVPDLRRLFHCEAVFLTLSAKLITRNKR